MAPQPKDIDDEEFEDSQTSTTEESRAPTKKPFGKSYANPMVTPTVVGIASEVTSVEYPWSRPNYPSFDRRPTGPPPWVNSDFTVSSSTPEWTRKTKATPLGGDVKSSLVTTSPFLVSTDAAWRPSNTSYGYGHGRPGGPGAKEGTNSGRILAAATITPVVLFVLIGALAFYLRRHKRQRQEIAATQKVQEMKMQSHNQPTAQPYMAPVPNIALSYAVSSSHLMPPPNPSAPPPVILGPIPSGANGAYFTGIDTSDVVSMTSASNLRHGPANHLSDNDSLAEPPPPYRPRSVAPPSFTNSSRHSSFRASVAPPTTSRTRLIERSPFEDPEDDDVVSELSGPTARLSEDAMSAVSDISYQNDPVVNRSSI